MNVRIVGFSILHIYPIFLYIFDYSECWHERTVKLACFRLSSSDAFAVGVFMMRYVANNAGLSM